MRLLAKGPDSSSGEVHRRSCYDEVHMEEERMVKVQEEEVEDNVRIEERTDNHPDA